MVARTPGIEYEFASTPATGTAAPVAGGVHWLRMPLPFALSHINLWLLEDDDEWVIVDTGLHSDEAKAIWEATLDGYMHGRAVNRVIATHLHPDHVGNAGWLSRRCNTGLHMTRNEYLLCRQLSSSSERPDIDAGMRFYRAAGFPADATDKYQKMFNLFGRAMSRLPGTYSRLRDGDTLPLGGRTWEIIVGNGHSPEHACLFCAELNVLISGDQILPTISSNVSVFPTDPLADPLHDWLTSIDRLAARLPDDVLVLPAHGKPFRGVKSRLAALRAEHEEALDKTAIQCRMPQRAIDVFPALFGREIAGSQLIMATGEAVAHLNWLLIRDRITRTTDAQGVHWYEARSATNSTT